MNQLVTRQSVSSQERLYLDFYELSESPFSITPDPEFLFSSHTHQNAIQKILYSINSRMGFILLIGEVGTGKTTICRSLLDSLKDEAETVYLINPSLSGTDLVASILDDLGVAYPEGASKKKLIDRLNRFLLAIGTRRPVVIIIDDAQTMDAVSLETLRLLSNLETDKAKLLQILLVGQPELMDTLGKTHIRQLRQRIAMQCKLEHLARKEIQGYISRRLYIAGDKGQIQFKPGAVSAVFAYSKGVPRLINKVCDYTLTAAFIEEAFTIQAKHVKKAVRELGNLDGFKTPGRSFGVGKLPLSRFGGRLVFAGVILMVLLVAVIRLPIWSFLEKAPATVDRQPNAADGSAKPTVGFKIQTDADKTGPNHFAGGDTPPDVETRDHQISAVKVIADHPGDTVSKLMAETGGPPAEPSGQKTLEHRQADRRVYTLHVGSYKNMLGVTKEISSLNAKGIQCYWRRVDLGQKGTWFRVYAGRFDTRTEALQYQTANGFVDASVHYIALNMTDGE